MKTLFAWLGKTVFIACAFNYDAPSSEFDKFGRIPVLKARMNADLHMAEDLKNTGKGNLFVIFGEPDIDILDADDRKIMVKVNGVDVFHPNSGRVESRGTETSLKAVINEEAWSTINSDISRPFKRPESGRIAVKVINHLGDEWMKVFMV